jgi:hypothetical protein
MLPRYKSIERMRICRRGPNATPHCISVWQKRIPIRRTPPEPSNPATHTDLLSFRILNHSLNEPDRPKSPQSVRAALGACPRSAATGMLRNSGGAGRTNHAGVPCEERRGWSGQELRRAVVVQTRGRTPERPSDPIFLGVLPVSPECSARLWAHVRCRR